jgi:hypothetical protein
VPALLRERRPVLHDRERKRSPRLQDRGETPLREGRAPGVLAGAPAAFSGELLRERADLRGELSVRGVQLCPGRGGGMQLRGAGVRSSRQEQL